MITQGDLDNYRVYFRYAITDSPNVADLELFWREQKNSRATLEIVQGSHEWDALVSICKERKEELLDQDPE